MHGEFLRLLFLQAHRLTEEYLRFIGMPAQSDHDSFRFRRAAFYSSLKSKADLIAAKAAALRVNMKRQLPDSRGCCVPSPLLLPLTLPSPLFTIPPDPPPPPQLVCGFDTRTHELLPFTTS
jgi:hypothetical protein